MRERSLTIPEIMLIGGTRVALGAGIGLLLGERLTNDQRKGAGWALLAVGALTTIPLVMGILNKPLRAEKLTAWFPGKTTRAVEMPRRPLTSLQLTQLSRLFWRLLVPLPQSRYDDASWPSQEHPR